MARLQCDTPLVVVVGGSFGSTMSHYCSLWSMKKCTKPSLGIKSSIKVEDTQFWYIIALIKTPDSQFFEIFKKPDGSLKFLKYPKLTVLWIWFVFSSTRIWWFFDSDFFFKIPRSNEYYKIQILAPKLSIINIIGFIIIEPNSSYPHTICTLLGT